MINTSKTIIFFGTDNFSLTALQGLIDAGYNIIAVVTKPDSKSGRGQILTMPSVKKIALKNNIPVWQPTRVADINNDIQKYQTKPTGVLVSFGKIIPQSTIDLFEPGIINVHPSLLPLYRGPSPIESVIKNGDSQTGVSIMKLSYKMDAGPIYNQVYYELSGNETRPELYQTMSKFGAKILLDNLPSIINGTLQPTLQDDNKATYCQLTTKNEAWLKPTETTANEAERIIRAHLGFPKTKLNILEHTIIITKAHVANEQKNKLDILCSDNKYLSIDELIAPSGRSMSGKDFINGYL